MVRFALTLILASFCAQAHADDWRLPKSLPTYLERIRPVSAQIKSILAEEGVPEVFFWLAVAESGGDASNVSLKGAAGLWQLMPHTARAYGLRVDSLVDERFDVEKSTRVAAKYIKRQLTMFDGNIMWAIAAYNAGGTNLKRKTGYKQGMDFERVKSAYYSAYALARTVVRLSKEENQLTHEF